jgi:TRAP-type C4-dicarboxylate transport system permease small subunit
MGRLIESLARSLALAGGVILLIESVLSLVSVLGRALFDSPIPGDFELIQLLSAGAIAAFLPYCQLKGGHVAVDFFSLNWPPSIQRLADRLAHLLLFLVAVLLTWRTAIGAFEIYRAKEASMVLGWPIYWGYIPLLMSLAALSVVSLYTIFQLPKTGSQSH